MSNHTDDKDKQAEGKSTKRISKDEAAFILGAQGKTKTKLSNVSGTTIDLVELKGGVNQLEVSGTAKSRARAMKYIEYVLMQRLGPVKIDESQHPEDLTILNVPADTVSFITGAKGAYLRHVEDEWWTLLFFLQVNPKCPPVHVDPNHIERLAIFGPSRQRRGAELKVMAAIENKQPGYFTKHSVATETETDDFDTDTMVISNDDYSYALGKNGNTRKKLARASNCIVEYIGRMAYFSGLKTERRHAKEYLQWLLHQRVGEHAHVEYKGRDDVSIIMVQRNCIGYVTGVRGASLRAIEEETNTFCFIEGAADDHDDGHKPLLIFGRAEDRRFAEVLVWERLSTKLDEMPDGKDSGRKGKGRGKNDSKGKKSGKSDGKSDGYGKGEGYAPEPERPVGKDISSDYQSITDEDAAFIMGQNGRTKRKIAAVSGAFLELKQNKLEITGKKDQRERAAAYVKIVMKQRLGPVKLEDIETHKDLTIIEVPAEAVSFVTGKGGAFLRMVEEEFGTLLFFIDYNKSRSRDQLERLAIFGAERVRRGAELKVMAAIEMKQAGHFTNRDAQLPMIDPQEGFATDRMQILEDDYSYALGKGGSTRKKIARASGCIIEYIGRHAYLSGTKAERARGRDYLTWLFRQRVGPVEVHFDGRDDVTVLPVPKDCVGFVTGHKGTSLRAVEEQTGTFCFIEGGRDDPHRDPKPLLIFGAPDARKSAEALLRQRVEQKLETGWVHEDYSGSGGYSGSGYADASGKSEAAGKGGRNRDGARRPGGGKGGSSGKSGSTSGDRWPAASHTQPIASAAPAETPQEPEAATTPAQPQGSQEAAEQEDDEAWGDWGGASDEECDDDSPAAAGHGAGAEATTPGANGTPSAAQTPGAAARWQDQPVPMTFKNAGLKGDQELELPPQLLHEEAWPELGGLGGGKATPKKGKKR